MPDSAAKKAWIKENTRFYGIKLNKNTDADLISYLEKVGNISLAFKSALRAYIAAEKEEK